LPEFQAAAKRIGKSAPFGNSSGLGSRILEALSYRPQGHEIVQCSVGNSLKLLAQRYDRITNSKGIKK
jgi:hypothetical protein